MCVCGKIVHPDIAVLTHTPSFIYHTSLESFFQPLRVSFLLFFPFFLVYMLCPRRLALLFSFYPFQVVLPQPLLLVLCSLLLSFHPAVTIPLFPALCDQLGDISPTVIPGDRSPREAALSFISPPSALTQFLLSTPGYLIAPARPPRLLFSAERTTETPKQSLILHIIQHGDISASTLFSSVSQMIYPPLPVPAYGHF